MDSIVPEKIVIDPTKGGQVEAKEKSSQALALNVRDGVWVWSGAVSVLQVDLFR
jgi:TATA-binding protein-associated factor